MSRWLSHADCQCACDFNYDSHLQAGDRPPPFYDQIQCVCYMMMTGRTRCDLVEVFRDAAARVFLTWA